MREIKFRAWDTERKQMFITFELKQKLNHPWGTFDDNIIFLQFTGLKDKNDKEIYEGDIVKWEAVPPKLQKEVYIVRYEAPIGIVEWNEAEFMIEQATRGLRVYNDPEFPNDDSFDEPFYGYEGQEFIWDELEVIGNIYENPELLE